MARSTIYDESLTRALQALTLVRHIEDHLHKGEGGTEGAVEIPKGVVGCTICGMSMIQIWANAL